MATIPAIRPIPALPTSPPPSSGAPPCPRLCRGRGGHRDQGLGRPDLVLIVDDRRSRRRRGRLHAERVRGRARAVAGQPRGHVRRPARPPRLGRGVVSTSGSANAATGAAGDADQARVGEARRGGGGVAVERVLHLSTGVIGTRLPLDRVAAGVDANVVPALTTTDDGARGRRRGPADDRLGDQGRDDDRRSCPPAMAGASRSPSAASPRASG